MSGMRDAWNKLRRDMRKVVDETADDMRGAVDDYHATNRKRAEKFSDRVFRKNRRRNPDAEWVYAETQSRGEVKDLLSQGWEIVATPQKATALGSKASVVILRKANRREAG